MRQGASTRNDGPAKASGDPAPAEAGRLFEAGNAAYRQGDVSGAAAAYAQALAVWPAYADAWLNLGAAYRRLERIDDAETYYNLVNQQPLNDGSPESEADFARLNRQVQALDRFASSEQSALLFALGKALDARGETDRAFDCLARANALHRSAVKFDIAASERLAAAIVARFDPALFARLEETGSPSERPVFVVGMPRSGTTLVEQIISAHPQVHGAGEIGLLPTLVSRMRSPEGRGFPHWTEALSGADLQGLAQAYLAALEPRGPGKARITDKTIGNFELLGLVHLCLPDARIIHCRRDPRDVCVSCFSTRFSAGHGYAYDLRELGRYWRLYDRVMTHWRQTLPPGRIFELDYEALVEDPEGWARRLIAHLGLPWDDACLRFYESRREVRTASFVQVRQPVYKGSVGRWRRFAAHLGPLLEALGEP